MVIFTSLKRIGKNIRNRMKRSVKMRIELAGTIDHPKPLVVTFESDDDFVTGQYIAEGYTHFDVICIGAGGGMGGGINKNNKPPPIPPTPPIVISYGGAGGGGGYHRVRGLLSELGLSCPVVVGVGGVLGTGHWLDYSETTDGGDGGYSSFGDVICRASGGKGGKHVSGISTLNIDAHGGEGGIGNSIITGGGAPGGICADGVASTAGTDGTLIDDIGKGGGGGAGGVVIYFDPPREATAGGRGAYRSILPLVNGPAGQPSDYNGETIIPGFASGARATPLNGLPTVYGQSGDSLNPGNSGIVVIRLTEE